MRLLSGQPPQQQQRAAIAARFRKRSSSSRVVATPTRCGGKGARERRNESRKSKREKFETSSMREKEGETLTKAMDEVLKDEEEEGREMKEYSRDGLDLVAIDGMLEPHKGHLQYRWEKFQQVKNAIESASGSLSQFADGYKEYGFSKKEDGTIVYKEWMPACNHAALVGDFNGWNGEATPMQRDSFGNWTCESSIVQGRWTRG
jgi:hypothetical protein